MSVADFSVTAIIAAYNEADIIEQVIADLVRQEVAVYLIDNGSTDATVEEASSWLGRGLVGIETFPPPGSARPTGFDLDGLLKRKEQLAHELQADWFINHDADEFRESPWPRLNLREAIHLVDRCSYNAIDFEVLNFRPTHDDFQAGDDVRDAFRFYEGPEEWDRVQIRAWKKQSHPVELAGGGHEAVFTTRRVFPVRFLLRHYPVRGQAHGVRKVQCERRARFLPGERERGWHHQYDRISADHCFIRDPTTLTEFDADAVRLRLMIEHRGVEELRGGPAFVERASKAQSREREALSRELDRQNREVERLGVELDGRNRDADRLGRALDERNHEAERLGRELDVRNRDLDLRDREVDRLGRALDASHRDLDRSRSELAAVHASWTWRSSAPLRKALKWLRTR